MRRTTILLTFPVVLLTVVAMAADDWQEVRFVCKPGSKVQVLVDGRTVGELVTGSLSAVEIRGETYSGTWIDDVELFFSGDSETLKKEHTEALKADLARRRAAWQKEAEEWDAKISGGHPMVPASESLVLQPRDSQ